MTVMTALEYFEAGFAVLAAVYWAMKLLDAIDTHINDDCRIDPVDDE